jgi:hypothetical protein
MDLRYPMPEDVSTEIQDILRRLRNLERSPRLTNSSMADDAGVERLRVGLLDDGSYGMTIDGGKVRALDVGIDNDTWLNQSLTTTPTVFASVTLAKPDWATGALVFGTLGLQVSNSSGGGQNAIGAIDIAGSNLYQLEMTVANGTTNAVAVPGAWNFTGLVSDITVRGRASVNSGTNGANAGTLAAQVIWLL